MCCGYQAKKEISDTLVDVVWELLIVNRKNDYRLPSELCGNYTVFLPSNFSGTHCGVRAIDSKCPWCVHYGQGKTIFLLSDELKPRKKIVFPLIITDACFPSCIRPLPALSVPSYRPYLVAPKFTTRPVIVHLQLGLSAAPSYPQV